MIVDCLFEEQPVLQGTRLYIKAIVNDQMYEEYRLVTSAGSRFLEEEILKESFLTYLKDREGVVGLRLDQGIVFYGAENS